MRKGMRFWLGGLLVLAACGGSDQESGPEPTPATTQPPSVSTTEEATTTSVEVTTSTTPDSSSNLAVAEELIDAFYSFDADRLLAALAYAESSQPWFLYYQGWAEGAHYAIVDRHPCVEIAVNRVDCPITVEDDLAKTLNYGFNVTDTFHLTFSDGRVVDLETSSDDPPIYEEALQWMFANKPELGEADNPCEGLFAGGPTPGECAVAVVAGFEEFMQSGS